MPILFLLSALAMPASAPDGPSGTWIIRKVERAPWASGAPDRRWLGTKVTFERGKVRARQPLGCAHASWERVSSPPEGLFQGNLPPTSATADAARLRIPDPAETLRLDCDTGSFDFHRTATGMVTALDNDILVLERRR